jgi:hypothetical protein
VTARERYDEIVDDLLARNAEVESAKMMGMPCVKKGGKLVAGFSADADAMVFKLTDAEARERALALDGAALFDPGGRGRPMREWVVVPPAHAETWPGFTELALGRT